MSELLAFVHIAYVYFYNGAFQRAYAVLQCYAGVGVSAGVEYYSVCRESHFLHLVDEASLYITLIIVYLNVRILLAQCVEISLESAASVYSGFACSQQIEVGSVYDLYFHNSNFEF